MTITIPATRDCTRCSGSGRFGNGDCFACNGTGRYEIPSFHRNTGDTMQNSTLIRAIATFLNGTAIDNEDGKPVVIHEDPLDSNAETVDLLDVIRVNTAGNDGRMLLRIGGEHFTVSVQRTDGKG